MIHQDLAKLDIPHDLRVRLQEATRELLALESDQERQAYISARSDLWRQTLPALAELCGASPNHCKCWYCESKGPGFTHHVDHFRPKNRVRNAGAQAQPGYWWLAFDSGNYRLSCQRCNTGAGKRDQFPLAPGSPRAGSPTDDIEDEIPLLLDPSRAADPVLLAYSEDGRVYPRHEQGFPAIAGEASIEVYDLNHVSKVEARKSVWLDCSELARRARRALNQLSTGPPDAVQIAKERFEDICRDIKRSVSLTAEYSAMARYCFGGTGDAWILELI